MPYQRIYKGFSVQNFKLGEVFKHQSYQGEIIDGDSGKLICRFDQAGKGDRTDVRWEDDTEEARRKLAFIGLEHDNEQARENGDEVVLKHDLEVDSDLFGQFAERGIEVLCIDHQFDQECYRGSNEAVFAHTSHGRYVHLPGHYHSQHRAYWYQMFDQQLRGDEEVMEIINDRYIED